MQSLSPRAIRITLAISATLAAIIGIVFFLGDPRTEPQTYAPPPLPPPLASAPIAVNPLSGTASRLYGTATVAPSVDATSAVEVAKKVVQEHADVLKGSALSSDLFRFLPGSPHQLVLAEQTVHPALAGEEESYTVIFQQEELGVPVEGTNVQVSLTASGELRSLGADVFPDLAMDVTPTVTREQAITVLQNRGFLLPDAETELTLLVEQPTVRDGPFRLVWKGMAPSKEKLSMSMLTVHAFTGEASAMPLEFYAGRVQATIPLDRPNDTPSTVPFPRVNVQAGGTTAQTDADGNFTQNGSSYSTTLESQNIETFVGSECPFDMSDYRTFSPALFDTCQTQSTLSNATGALTWVPQPNAAQPMYLGALVNFHALAAERAAVEQWGFTRLNSTKIYGVVQVQSAPCDAYFVPMTSSFDRAAIIMGVADSRCAIMNKIDQFADVSYHEYGHYVFYREYGSSFPRAQSRSTATNAQLEAGAISEGWADFMACTMTGEPNLDPLAPYGRVCNSSLSYNGLIAACGSDKDCHDGGPIFSTAMFGAETGAGVDKDAFMTAVFRGIAQRPTTMKGFGDAIASATTDAAIRTALVSSFGARGITVTVPGGGTGPSCGDGVVSPPEVCDGSNFGSKTCASETGGARPNGQLTCQSSCTVISNTACATTGGGGGSGDLGPGTGGTGGDGPGTHTIPVGDRSYIVYVPSTYNDSTPARFAMLLPGQGGNAQTIINQWKKHADADNLIIASTTPKGTSNGYSDPDIAAIFQALNDIPAQYNIAVNYISLWGYSAGGHLALAIGLDNDGGDDNANFFNALAVQAGNLGYARQLGIYPTPPTTRRIPINLRVGATDPMNATVKSDEASLKANQYPVTFAELPGQGHEYGQADADAAWTFLKGINKAGASMAACTTNGCTTMNAVQCDGTTGTKVCQQKQEGSTACLGWSTPTACPTGTTCQAQGTTAAACTGGGGDDGGGTPTTACTTNGCPTINAVQCDGTTGTKTCQAQGTGAAACLGWSTPTACPTGQTCANQTATTAACTSGGGGTPTTACTTNGCPTINAVQCDGTTGTKTCQAQGTGAAACLGWSTPTACPTGQTCANQTATTAACGTGDGGGDDDAPVCGDDVAEGAEVCDGDDLGGHSCITLGFQSGTAVCHSTCYGFDVTSCIPGPTAVCGDGTVTSPEQCDDRNTVRGDGCSTLCEVERTSPMAIVAILAHPMSVAPAGSPTMFDCRRSLGYRLACGWDYGDGATSTGLGDYTDDGVVDLLDMRYFAEAVYGSSGDTAPTGTSFDLNADGLTDTKDLQQLLALGTTHVVSHSYLQPGTYTATLTVSGMNAQADIVRDTKSVTLRVKSGQSSAFAVSAGPDLTGRPGADVTLLGSTQGGVAPYSTTWRVEGGPAAPVGNASALIATFKVPDGAATGTTFTIALEGTDGAGATARDTVTVRVGATTGVGNQGNQGNQGNAGDPGTAQGGACTLPAGKKMGALAINTLAFTGITDVKVFPPDDPNAVKSIDAIVEVGESFMVAAAADNEVDAERRFIVGSGYGATSALLAGLPQPMLAGIIHIDQESVRTCASADSACARIQAMIEEQITTSERHAPIVIAYKQGVANRGAKTAEYLRSKGYVDDQNLFVLETKGSEPSAEEFAQILTWMRQHPADDSCTVAAAPAPSFWARAARALFGVDDALAASNDEIRASWEVAAENAGSAYPASVLLASTYTTAFLLGAGLLLAIIGAYESFAASGSKSTQRKKRAERMLLYGLVGVVIVAIVFLGSLIALS